MLDLLSGLGNFASLLLGTGILSPGSSGYLEDREHTEMREDTAIQRRVADMRAAGINPYTIGSSSAQSSASQVGANQIANRLELLGYVLDLQNLSLKNKKITNDLIGDVLGSAKNFK